MHAAASAGFDMLMYTSAVGSKGRQGLLMRNAVASACLELLNRTSSQLFKRLHPSVID